MTDFSKLSDADLKAIAAGKMADVSDAGLTHLAGETPKPDNSAGQWAGVATRALAPYGAAALLGAGVGSVVPVVGTAAGAALGPAALAVTDLGATVYNAAATPFGAPRMPTGSEAVQDLAERAGIGSRPQTGAQRVFGTALESATGAGATARAAWQTANMVTSPTTRAVLNRLAMNPGAQTLAGAASGGTVATAQEAGIQNQYALSLLGLAGGVAPSLAGIAGKGVIRTGANLVEPFMPGGAEAIKARAYLDALGKDPAKINEALNLLRQGYTVEQTATKMRSTGLAALSGTARYATPEVRNQYLAREQGVQQGQANRLAALSANLSDIQGQNVLRGDVTQSAIAGQQGTLAATVPNPSQLKVGRIVSGTREAAMTDAQAKIVTPAYNAAFDASPGTFSFAPVESAALGIRGTAATTLNPDQAPLTAAALRLYETERPAPGAVGALMLPAEPKPAMVTLKDADAFIKAINQDLGAISGSQDAAANATRRNLMRLKTAAMDAIESGTTPEAKALYDKARELHRTKVAGPFLEGWMANFSREGATGVPIQNLEKVSSTVLGSEDKAVRFVSALGDRPRAMNTLSRGIEGEYRMRVVKDGIVDPKAHDAFMAKYGKSLSVLDDAGLDITAKLNGFGSKAKALEAQGLSAAENTKAQAAEIAKAQQSAQRALATLTSSNVTPQQSATQLMNRLQTLPEVKSEIEAIRSEMRNPKFFESLAREGVKAGGGVKGLATGSMGKAPHMLSHASMLANYVLARLGGKLDAKLAGEVAADLLNSGRAADVLAGATEAAKRGRVMTWANKPTAVPTREQLGVTNLMAPAVSNAMAGQ